MESGFIPFGIVKEGVANLEDWSNCNITKCWMFEAPPPPPRVYKTRNLGGPLRT